MSKKLSYHEALHAVQTGIAYLMEYDPSVVAPKHLRVGIDSMKCEQAALVKLLVEKGIISDEEYVQAITDEMNEEVKRAEQRLQDRFGGKTKFTLR